MVSLQNQCIQHKPLAPLHHRSHHAGPFPPWPPHGHSTAPVAPHLTPGSSITRIPFNSSVKRGSTLMWMEMSFPSASAAFRRTPRLESCRALVKVVCSWGRNGFRAIPTCLRDPHTKPQLWWSPRPLGATNTKSIRNHHDWA